jgi:DNA-binding NarL/FixJ family response regulator
MLIATSREFEVVNLMIQGLSDKRIAKILYLQEKSIQKYRENFCKRNKIKNGTRTKILAIARYHPIVVRQRGEAVNLRNSPSRHLTQELYRQGQTMSYISRKLNKSLPTIHRYLGDLYKPKSISKKVRAN